MWGFLFVAALWIIKLSVEKSKESRDNAINNMITEDRRNGVREAVYVWHFFWDEIVPAIYAEAKQSGVDVDCRRVLSDNRDFIEIGKKLYGRDPYDHAVYVARWLIRKEGHQPFYGFWGHSPLYDSSISAEELESRMRRFYCVYAMEEKRLSRTLCRPGYEFMLSDYEEQWYLRNCDHKEWLPSKDDKRRKFFCQEENHLREPAKTILCPDSNYENYWGMP